MWDVPILKTLCVCLLFSFPSDNRKKTHYILVIDFTGEMVTKLLESILSTWWTNWTINQTRKRVKSYTFISLRPLLSFVLWFVLSSQPTKQIKLDTFEKRMHEKGYVIVHWAFAWKFFLHRVENSNCTHVSQLALQYQWKNSAKRWIIHLFDKSKILFCFVTAHLFRHLLKIAYCTTLPMNLSQVNVWKWSSASREMSNIERQSFLVAIAIK
jgi:hypothetical protein